jgi:hypothetical protein
MDVNSIKYAKKHQNQVTKGIILDASVNFIESSLVKQGEIVTLASTIEVRLPTAVTGSLVLGTLPVGCAPTAPTHAPCITTTANSLVGTKLAGVIAVNPDGKIIFYATTSTAVMNAFLCFNLSWYAEGGQHE